MTWLHQLASMGDWDTRIPKKRTHHASDASARQGGWAGSGSIMPGVAVMFWQHVHAASKRSIKDSDSPLLGKTFHIFKLKLIGTNPCLMDFDGTIPRSSDVKSARSTGFFRSGDLLQKVGYGSRPEFLTPQSLH